MGAHFNPISLNIVNSESTDAIESSWDASVLGFIIYSTTAGCVQARNEDSVLRCASRTSRTFGHAKDLHYQVDKPSSDCTKQVWSFAKKKFGPDIKEQTCGQHATGECNFRIFWKCSQNFRTLIVQLLVSDCVAQEKSFRKYFEK
jgi:hypothetical protein